MNNNLKNVQDVLENYQSAVYEQDLEKFLSAYAPNVHIYDCWENWEYDGVDKWSNFIKKWFNGMKEEGVLSKAEFGDLLIEENENVAFVHCKVTYADYNQSGEKLRQLANRFTFGLKKEQSSWYIVHEHSSLPINMETGKGIFD